MAEQHRASLVEGPWRRPPYRRCRVTSVAVEVQIPFIFSTAWSERDNEVQAKRQQEERSSRHLVPVEDEQLGLAIGDRERTCLC